MLLREKLRPWKTLKLYQQLVDLLNKRIELGEKLSNQQRETITRNDEYFKFLTELVKRQGEKITDLQTPGPPTPMPLPTVEAVEGLVAAFFHAESVGIAQQALEATRNLGQVTPEETRATHMTLLKLWKLYAMRKLEQAAKQDVL
jgi:hypothetical protein